jgi:hypothetical protein
MAITEPLVEQEVADAPIHALRDYLETARLLAIGQAAKTASGPGDIPDDLIARIGHLHLALRAVREEIKAHTPRLGSGSEAPLP